MHDLNVALAAIAALVLVFGLVSGFVRGHIRVLSEPLAAMLLGIVIGPSCLDLLRLHDWGHPLRILEQVARVALAVSVMATALRLPDGYFKQQWRAMLTILGPGMVLTWLISGGISYLFFDISVLAALILGAVLTPTDPVVAGTVVAGEVAKCNIPARVRHFLSGETGANDGGAYPLVLFGILLLQRSPGEAFLHWVTVSLLWNVGGAILMGAVIGYAAARVECWSESRKFTEKTSITTVTLALSLFTLSVVKLLGSDGILGVFVAGVVFRDLADKRDQAAEESVQDAVNRLFGFPVFVLFGMALPWLDWAAYAWVAILFPIAILLLRRIPMILLLQRGIPPLETRADRLFAGWFGPIGVGAIYYATMAENQTHDELYWIVGSLVVLASVIAHGMTSTPFTDLYHRVTGEPKAEE